MTGAMLLWQHKNKGHVFQESKLCHTLQVPESWDWSGFP